MLTKKILKILAARLSKVSLKWSFLWRMIFSSFGKNLQKVCFVLLVYSFSLPLNIMANISKTFTDSLPFTASAGYSWSTWDFLTNPYLYYLQKDDALSAIINSPTDLTRGDYLIASRFSIVGFPIFLTFGINQPVTAQARTENPLDADRLNLTTETRARVLIGTNFGPELFNLGIGFFGYYARQTKETLNRDGTLLKKESYSQSESGSASTADSLPTRLGVELGQNLPGRSSPAWTLSLEYRKWAGFLRETNIRSGDETDTRFVDSPFLKFPSGDFPDSSLVLQHDGKTREEVSGNFLGWWPLGDFGDTGLLGDFYVGSGAGRNSDSLKGTVTLPNGENVIDFDKSSPDFERYFPEIILKARRVSITAFLDYDFRFLNESVFRLTPWVRYTNIKETLVEKDPTEKNPNTAIILDDFLIRQEKADFGLNFRLALNLTKSKNFTFYLGWSPVLTLYDQTVTENNQEAEEGVSRRRTIVVPILYADTRQFSLGFSYHFSKRLHLHFLAGAESDRFDISSWDIGLDYIFTTDDG